MGQHCAGAEDAASTSAKTAAAQARGAFIATPFVDQSIERMSRKISIHENLPHNRRPRRAERTAEQEFRGGKVGRGEVCGWCVLSPRNGTRPGSLAGSPASVARTTVP